MDIETLFQNQAEPQHYQKGEHLFRQGERTPHLYFIQSGLMKAYYLSPDGKEFVKSFLQQGEVIGSLSSAYAKLPCSFNLLCLNDCHVRRIPFDALYTQSQQNLELATHVIQSLLKLAMKKERREFEFLCLPAEERYRQLLKEQPEIPEIVTQNDIARYLGITPVALSRIRKRVNTHA